jgi:uncharacterized phage protein gp47/JayE
MSLRLYRISELLRAGKVVARSIPGVSTALGSDLDLTLHAATRLLHGGQVAGAYVFEQLDPRTADADNRDRMIDQYGLSFAKPATPARGLMVLLHDLNGGFRLDAGTVIEVPGTAFHDGAARSYRTLESVDCPGLIGTTSGLANGSSVHKLRLKTAASITAISAGDVLRVTADAGNASSLVVVRRSNQDDQSLDLYTPIRDGIRHTAEESAQLYTRGVRVVVECVTPGAIGNAPAAIAHVSVAGVPDQPFAMIVEMGGGGNEVGDVDGDTARVVRVIEDTIACPPSFGNAQHWREIALACPDVDLDDAVVYQHVRGPGTVDIVCIGRRGSLRSPAFPGARLEFAPWGNNTRRIGEVQAAKVEAWCRARRSYFDDLRVRSVEWDYRGNTFAELGPTRFHEAVSRVDVGVEAEDGYGPDAVVALDVIPFLRDASRLYPARAGGTIDLRLKPGHRVWAMVGHATTNGRHPFVTVVTEVVSVAADRAYATITAVTALAPGTQGEAFAGSDPLDLRVLRWGTAGPVTEALVNAVYDYFDMLGPGSYVVPPKGPGYVQRFSGSDVAAPVPGVELMRWPPEGRRWDSGLRASELRTSLVSIEGVRNVRLGRLADDLLDYDPAPLTTLALNGVLPRYI